MLSLKTETQEYFDSVSKEFVEIKGADLRLEHSLVSIAKWESKWKKPFLSKEGKKTPEQSLDYIRCMILNQNIDPNVVLGLSKEQIDKINSYIEDEATATVITKNTATGLPAQPPKKTIFTSEELYHFMIVYNIPVKFEKWHLSRLLMLITICQIRSESPKKMSKNEIFERNRALNEARKRKYNTKG